MVNMALETCELRKFGWICLVMLDIGSHWAHCMRWVGGSREGARTTTTTTGSACGLIQPSPFIHGSVQGHHKSDGANKNKNVVLRAYYAVKPLFLASCLGQELCYLAHFVLAKEPHAGLIHSVPEWVPAPVAEHLYDHFPFHSLKVRACVRACLPACASVHTAWAGRRAGGRTGWVSACVRLTNDDATPAPHTTRHDTTGVVAGVAGVDRHQAGGERGAALLGGHGPGRGGREQEEGQVKGRDEAREAAHTRLGGRARGMTGQAGDGGEREQPERAPDFFKEATTTDVATTSSRSSRRRRHMGCIYI